MASPQLLQQLIRRQLLAGQCPSDTFNYICCERASELATITPEQITKWLSIAQNITAQSEIPSEFQLPVRKISHEFQQAQIGLEARRCPANKMSQCKLHLLSTRYSLDVHAGRGEAEFYLFDNFYGQKDRLRITGNRPELSDDNFQLASIDAEHFFLIKTNYTNTANQTHSFTVYLLELNSIQREARILDWTRMDGCLYRVVVDAKNPQKFAIILCHNNKYWMRRGELSEDGVEYGTLENLNFKSWYPSLRLNGNKLFGVAVQDQCGYMSFAFGEMTLGTDDNQFEKSCEIDTDEETTHQDYWNNNYVWFENSCYLFKRNEHDRIQLYKLDLETKKMTEMPNKQFDSVCAQQIDQNGLLTVCTLNEKSGQHAWYRHSLKAVSDLSSLAMSAIGQQMMFTNDKHALIEKIPINLRPFGWEF